MTMQTVCGYELLELLGEGPHGIVYKARDPRTSAWVAVKLFHAIEAEDTETLVALKHPHLAALCDVGRTELQSFRVSEYLSGGTLENHIRSLRSVGDAFPADQILAYAGQIGEALRYAHDQGVPHGNLKTANVMFSEDGTLKLTDFSLRSKTSLPAERIADLSRFGSLLYELATAESPLPGVAVQPIDAFRKDLPAAFVQLVSRLLNNEAQERYEDFRQVVAALRSIAAPPTMTRPAGGPLNAPAAPGLPADRVLAGRFRIRRFIARGGMGEVYEAEDLELRERVALKTIRPEIAGAEQALGRFKREIHLARRVTHPNVCRIFDLFHDVVGSEKVTFLTMELLDGETLHQRIQRMGRIETNEALAIIRQMAAGLAAAHRAGIIHRDFKSSNVILAPESGDGQEFRAVVTDFGLARSRSAPAQEAMTTVSNGIDAVGTPAYMAPEQLEGGEITAAADIYAFGVVIYEMVTGTLPFTGESGLAVALKRLQGPPPSPRTHAPELNAFWEEGILRCLERTPAARFESVDDLVKALSGELVTAPSPRTARPGRFGKAAGRRLAGFASAAVLIASVLLGSLATRDKGLQPDSRSRRAVAVLGFKNLTGQPESAWLSAALSEMLTTELAAGEKLRAVPGENVARMTAELSLPESSSFATDTLAKIRSYLGADILIYGSYLVLNGSPTKIRVDLRLQDSVQGSVLTTISEEGYAADLLELVSRSGASLRDRLGVGKLAPGEVEAARAALPATPEAARHYSEGLAKLRVYDGLGARIAFEKAVKEDERHALAHAGLAASWSMSGYAQKAKEQSKIALDLSTNLGREDQLLVEGRAREASLEWHQAAEVYRTLSGFFPDNLDYGLRLASAQTSAGEAKDGLATIEKLRKLPAPDRDSPQIDLAEARAAGAVSDFKHQQEMAARAADKGKKDGTRLVLAGARLIEGGAFAGLGELNRARAAFEEARQIYSQAGDRWGEVNASIALAYAVMQSGDPAGAQSIFERSLTTYLELGDRKGEANTLTFIGMALRSRGELLQAKARHEQALKIRLEIGDRIGEAGSRNNLANVLSLLGDSKAARAMFEAALPVFQEIGNRDSVATIFSNLGDLAYEESDLSRARELYEESRATFEKLGNKSSLAHELSRLGELELINGDLAAARKRYQAALDLRKQIGEKGSVAESQLAIAQIALHEGDPVSAETAAKAAAEEFSASNRPDEEASAMAVLARSFVVRAKYAESAVAIRRAEELSTRSSDRSVRISVAITAASIRAAAGEGTKSLEDLDAIIKQARDAGLFQLELEARLTSAEIQIALGNFRAGRLQLDALEREASRRGYKYIADRAAAARRKIPAGRA